MKMQRNGLTAVTGMALGLVLLCGPAGAETSAAAPVAINIDRQPIGDAINAFAAQTGLQILLRVESMPRDVTAPRVSGTLTPRAALKQLLEGSGLRYEYVDERTVAIMPAKSRAQQPGANASSFSLARVDGAAVEPEVQPEDRAEDRQAESEDAEEEMVVTGTHIRGTYGKGTINPVLTYTREDIERSGVSSLADFRRLIPQLSVGATQNNGYTEGFGGVARVNVELRGLGNNNTLVLVDGRRLPKADQSNGADNYDLNGIPLSAIERIDVLLDGASAVYGADAQSGVVNVILKKDYVGTTVDFSHDNTFDDDAGVTRISLFSGYRRDRMAFSVGGSWEQTNALAYTDRRELLPYSLTDPFLMVGGTGRVYMQDGSNLPGLTRNEAAIPAGSDGVNVTVADYAAAGVQPARVDRNQFNNLLNPSERLSASLDASYRFHPAAELFFSVRWSEFRNFNSSAPTYLSTNIPAGSPGNPFGVTIRMQKMFWDRPLGADFTTRNPSALLGLRGAIAGDWRYEAAASWTEGWSKYDPFNANFYGVVSTPAINNPDVSQRPILLYDSTQGPVDQPIPLSSLTAAFFTEEESTTRTYDFKADGSVFRLPAGAVKMAAGGEFREEEVTFDRALIDPFYGTAVTRPTTRDARAVFAETLIPLVAAGQSIPLVSQLSLTAALRRDSYSDFGDSTNPRYGLLYRPVAPVMLRASRSETFKAPLLWQLYQPQMNAQRNFQGTQLFDPARGEYLIGFVDTISGGTPTLSPESSVNTNFGMVLDIPWVNGLTLSADYWDIRVQDRIGGLTLQDRLAIFPELFEREPPGPDGRPGRITRIDQRSVNIAELRTNGIDYRLNYQNDSRAGYWYFDINVTDTMTYETRVQPGATPTVFRLTRPLRGVMQLNLDRGQWSGGVSAIYQGRYEYGFGSESPRTKEWGLSTAYTFDYAGAGGWWKQMLDQTRVSLAIQNLFNTNPPDAGNIDPRLRRYVVTLRKSF